MLHEKGLGGIVLPLALSRARGLPLNHCSSDNYGESRRQRAEASLKLYSTVAATGLLFTFLGVAEPTVAQAVGTEPLPSWATLGVSGASLAVVLVVVSRVLPRISELMSASIEKAAEINARALGEVKESVEGMRDDQSRYQESHLKFLRELVHQGRDNIGEHYGNRP